jgi:hypothetical protein
MRRRTRGAITAFTALACSLADAPKDVGSAAFFQVKRSA